MDPGALENAKPHLDVSTDGSSAENIHTPLLLPLLPPTLLRVPSVISEMSSLTSVSLSVDREMEEEPGARPS